MYLNRDQPALNETPPSASESAAGLPASHPPVDFAERIAVLERQSRTDPSNPDYRIQMGNLYYDSGQYGKAREAYEAGLRLRPGDPGIETDLATCYHYLGQHEKALELLDRVLESHPNFSQALFNKGIVLMAGRNDIKGALGVWERLLASDPDFANRTNLEQRIRELKSAAQ